MSRDKPGRYLRELAIIVLGVAIALAGDSWRESLLESRQSQEYLDRLSVDVAESLTILREQQERFATVQGGTGELSRLVASLNAENQDRAIALFYVSSATANRREALGPDVTMRELVASGRLGLLPDADVRLAAVDFFERVDGLSQTLARADEMFRPRFVRLAGCIAARCDARLDEAARRQLVSGGSHDQDFVDRLLDEEQRARLLQLMRTADFGDDLREQLMNLDSAARRFDAAIESGESLEALLR